MGNPWKMNFAWRTCVIFLVSKRSVELLFFKLLEVFLLHDGSCFQTTCINIKYVAYTLPKSIKMDKIALEAQNSAAELPLSQVDKETSSCTSEQLPKDVQPLCKKTDDTQNTNHAIGNSSPVTSNQQESISSDNHRESGDLNSKGEIIGQGVQHSTTEKCISTTEYVSSIQVSPVATSCDITSANTNCHDKYPFYNMSKITVSNPNEQITNVCVNHFDETISELSSKLHSIEENLLKPTCKNAEHLHTEKKMSEGDTLASPIFVEASSSSPASTSTLIESPSTSTVPLLRLATSTVDAEPDDEGGMSDASSETTMASLPSSPRAPSADFSNPTKPCKVVLCRLPTAYFLNAERKRKCPEADDNLFETEHISVSPDEKNSAPPKKVRLGNNHLESTIHCLMVKYRASLRELTELRKRIQQLRNQKRAKVIKLVSTSLAAAVTDKPLESQLESAVINSNISSSTESISTVTTISSSVISSASEIYDPSSKKAGEDTNVVSITNGVAPTIASSEIQPNLDQLSKQNQSVIPLEESLRKEDSNLSGKIPIECRPGIKGDNIASSVSNEFSKQSAKPDVTNAGLGVDVSRCLSLQSTCSPDISWLLKYARISSLDKGGTKVVDPANLISRSVPDLQLPLLLQKSSLLDFVRLPLNRQKYTTRINSFQNTNAAIRSNLRPIIPTTMSNYAKPIIHNAPPINQTSELENLRQFLSAFGSQPMETPATNSNLSSFDLMAYLERNHINGSSSLANQALASFPFSLNGCNPNMRHNLIQTHRQSVSTQTAQMDLINQYFCRRSKPVPSVFAGRTRPMHSKRTFGHAFGADLIGKRSFPGPSKRVRYANEEYMTKITSANPVNRTCSNNIEINPHKLLPLPSGMAPSYHIFTEINSHNALLKPLYSINQQRVICLTPPTEVLKKKLVCNGPCEVPSSQAPSSRPRSSSANAAEVYDTLADVTAGTMEKVKQLAASHLEVVQSLTPASTYDYFSEIHSDKRSLPANILSNQLSPRQKDSFYSIPRKSLFPIFSRSSKLHAPNLHHQTIFPSNKNGNMSRDLCSLSIHQQRKVSMPTPSHFQLSGWNAANLGISDSSMIRGQDNNVTLDLSLSKKRKRSDSRFVGDPLKVDISKSCKVANNLVNVSGIKFSLGNKSSDQQNIVCSNVFPSSLTVTKLSVSNPNLSTFVKGKVTSGGNDASECPNIIDFRKSMPITSFKLCDLKNLPYSKLVSVSSNNVENCFGINSISNSSTISNASENSVSLSKQETVASHSEESQINTIILESKTNEPKLSSADNSPLLTSSANVFVTFPTLTLTSEVVTSSSHDSKIFRDLATSSIAPVDSLSCDSTMKCNEMEKHGILCDAGLTTSCQQNASTDENVDSTKNDEAGIIESTSKLVDARLSEEQIKFHNLCTTDLSTQNNSQIVESQDCLKLLENEVPDGTTSLLSDSGNPESVKSALTLSNECASEKVGEMMALQENNVKNLVNKEDTTQTQTGHSQKALDQIGSVTAVGVISEDVLNPASNETSNVTIDKVAEATIHVNLQNVSSESCLCESKSGGDGNLSENALLAASDPTSQESENGDQLNTLPAEENSEGKTANGLLDASHNSEFHIEEKPQDANEDHKETTVSQQSCVTHCSTMPNDVG